MAVSAYWAAMFAGRAVLGPVAQRAGPARVPGWAVAGVPLGAALMAVPGPGFLAIGALGARVLAPSLLVLALAMCGVHALLSRSSRAGSTLT